jgi:hypothetical protein
MVARTRSGSNPHSQDGSSSNRLNPGGVSSGSKAHLTVVDKSTPKQQNVTMPVVINSDFQIYPQHGEVRFTNYPKVDDIIHNMKASLGRFTRANDRRMVLRTLKEVKYLKALPIDPRPPPMIDLEELEREVAKETIVLNGQGFSRKTKYGRTSTDFLHVVHELCYQLCEISTCPTSANSNNKGGVTSSRALPLSPDTLYYDILCRLARTITSADCFAKLKDILGSHELILMNCNAERKPKAKKGQAVIVAGATAKDEIGPIEIYLFEEGGNIHAHIVTTLGFGLYRKLDVNTGRPWIKMQVELNERMNFSSGSQVRHVTVHWPDMYV